MTSCWLWISATVWISTLLSRASEGVHIEDLRVPPVVEHNVNVTALLDCVYELRERESDLLTVKWFFKDETHLVYQWGRGLPPADSGVLKGRLHLGHVASQDQLKRHRALVIHNPTIELSGNYICRVATRQNVVTGSKKMIVYAPARTMNLTQDGPVDSSVNVSCAVEGAYPVPHLDIFMKQESRQNRVLLKNVLVQTSRTEEGVYEASALAQLQARDIHPQTLFECIMTIPDTQYSLKRVITYYSGATLAASTSAGRGMPGPLAVVPLCLLLVPAGAVYPRR
ncbi:uncharacterized protein LOC119107637 [Pollicipes pollicipes]|uniref:uncharacterized protein LOC119107637 n=1 Tax=Pollicipes pollicipes TaxID=41117 RepID=UPI001885254D|nr:uncharacterized protein LOC119107637 [Pollicipes pollicipes]